MTVKQQQCLLTYLGYNPGTIDGIDGPLTQAAMSKFVSDYGLSILTTDEQIQSLIVAVDGTVSKVAAESSDSGSDVWTDGSSGDFWDDIQYFKPAEFRCQCNGECNKDTATMAEETVRMCDEIRKRIGKPITVSSGIRCPTHNAEVGGVSNSNHLYGKAADLVCSGCSVDTLYSTAEAVMAEMIPGRGGLGKYSWGIHIDNGTYSRWNG